LSRRTVLIAAVVAPLLLSGCLPADRNLSDEARTASHWGAVALFDNRTRVLTPTERAQVAKQDLNVMALSGGGADGAFGAGLLLGWTEAGTRPQFDIVTGVSTGALMSSFVFLGPRYDQKLAELYTTMRTTDVFTTRLDGLFGDSLNDTAPLRARIAQAITEDVLDAVAEEHRKGRRLFVATTNLDSGTVAVWNMGAIAASDKPERVELYRDILLASAAVPGFFKPVMIPAATGTGKQMHVDGGVKAPVLLRTFMLAGPYKRKNVYILVNGTLRLRSADHSGAVTANLAGIAKRSITELLRGLMYKQIYQIYVTVQRAGANFHLTFIPDDIEETKDPLNFQPEEMKKLFDAGRTLARKGNYWLPEPPRLENLERIENASRRAIRTVERATKPKPAAGRGADTRTGHAPSVFDQAEAALMDAAKR
jgi:predicted acylesterase/phospholipase RssA